MTKRREYAAGIPEDWIVDPDRETMTVLGLDAEAATASTPHGLSSRGHRAESRLLDGLAVEVSAPFDLKV